MQLNKLSNAKQYLLALNRCKVNGNMQKTETFVCLIAKLCITLENVNGICKTL